MTLTFLPAVCAAAAMVVSTLGAAAAAGDKSELLSRHQTIASFQGIAFRQCLGLTTRCPELCGDSGEFATFRITRYLAYEKPGEYGDSQQTEFLIQVSDFHKKPVGDAKILATIKALKQGDAVALNWDHDYLTRDGSSFPVRTVTKLEPAEQAAEAAPGAAAPQAAAGCDNADGVLDETVFVFVTSPPAGQRVKSGFIVSGCSLTFESTINFTLRARDGSVLASGHANGGGADGHDEFSFKVDYKLAERQIGHLEVFADDPSDGEGFPPPRSIVPLILQP